MQRVKLGLVCLSWLYLASAVSAQSAVVPVVDPPMTTGSASVQSVVGGGVLQGTYFDIRHVIGDGVGYQNSYSQIGSFTPFWINEDAFIAPNVRLTITNSTQVGVSSGLVGRKYVDSIDRIFGLYGYYDNDEDANNFRYGQVTVGAETLGSWWDLRANGYFLDGTNNNFISATGVGGNPFYVSNNIAFAGQQLRDGSLGGGDAEIGAPFSANAKWLRGYSGVYGYHTGTSETIGFRGRIEAMVSNDLTLQVMVSQDALYGTNINGVIDFKFSGFQPTKYFPNLTTRQRMLNPVQRNWRIATHTYEQNVNIDAINPTTHRPYFVTFVNNSAPAGGNGTFENPFKRLPSSAPGDIILVERGTSSAAHPVLGGIVLSDNQRLLGDGILSQVQLSAQYGANTINGTFNLPGTSNSGLYPFVSNPNGNTVTLANNNEVAGLNLLGAGGSAITNTAAGSNNFNLHNLEIAQNAVNGISLVNASGIGIISEINAGTTDHANPNGYGNNLGGGIQISSGSAGLDLQMSYVNMNASPPGAELFGISLNANNGLLFANLNNVSTNGNGTGIQLSETSQQLTANLNNVRADHNTGVGIKVQGTGGSISIAGNNAAAMNNGSNNLQIGSQIAPIVDSTVSVTMNQGYFTNSTGGSGIVFSESGGNGTLFLPATAVYGNHVDGLAMYGTNASILTAYVSNGVFTNNGRDAFHVEAGSAATINLNVAATNATGSDRDGLYFNMGQDSVLNTTFLGSNLSQSDTSAVYGLLANFATANLYFSETSGANSGANGFYLNASSNSLANISVYNGTFAESGRTTGGSSSIDIQSNDAEVNLLTDFTPGNNDPMNQAYGLTLNIQNGSQFTGEIDNGNFAGNLVSAVNATVTSNSDATLTLLNTSGANSGWDGFVAHVNDAGFTANVTNGSFDHSGRYGLNFDVENGGVLTANFNNTAFNNSAVSGINGVVNGADSLATINLGNLSNVNSSAASGVNFFVNAGTLNVNSTSSSISNNGLGGVSGSGVLGVVTNFGTANLDFQNATINNNLDNGVFVTTIGANVNAIFAIGSVSNNGIKSPTPANFNDGIRLDVNGGTGSSLQILNGETVSGNGSNGVTILAANSTQFQGLFESSSITNNGAAGPLSTVQNGAGIQVNADSSSVVNLQFSNMTIDNTLAGGTQQYGFLSTSSNAANITATLDDGVLSNNAIDAINSTVGSGSTTTITLVDTVGDNSEATGALFSVTTGGTLNFNDSSTTGSTTSSFSNEGGSGILVVVDGTNSVANFNIDSLNLSSDGGIFGGHGFSGLVTNGGNLNAFIANSDILNNANQGIQITAANANSLADFNVFGSLINFNRGEGLLINVTDQAQVWYRSIDNQYNDNGANGSLDGVTVNAGSATSAGGTAILLFSGDQVDTNAGNGFTLTAVNGATLTTEIQSLDISNNLGYGIASMATGAATNFNLLMSGTNTLTNNGLGAMTPLTFSGINEAVIDVAGTFDNSPGDGVHIELSNINDAVVAVTGVGSIDSSTLDGINISLTNIANGSVLISGLTEINGSGGDGISISFDNVANGALAINGPTTINDNGEDAIDISLNNSTLVDNMSFGAANIRVLTLTNNLPEPLNGTLPVPVDLTLNQTGLVPTTALTINDISSDTSANTGFSIVSMNSSIQSLTVSNNTVSTVSGTAANTGDGILFNLTNTPVQTLTISGNQIGGTTSNGVDFQLNAAPIGTVDIFNNFVGVLNGGAGSAIGDTLPIIVPGFTGNTLAANDDGSILAQLGFTLNFFGNTTSTLFVNNNGNVTFNSALFTYTPFSLLSTATPIIAPFFADVDTRAGSPVTYGTTTIDGHAAFGVDWVGVEHFDALTSGLPTNTFQLVIIDRSDIAPGDFDFEFNYTNIQWEAGEASGANPQGLGGSSARAGYSNGTNTSFELAGSAVNGALLNDGPAATSLIHNSLNSGLDGRYIFFVRNGTIGGADPTGTNGIELNATNGSNLGGVGGFNVVGNTVENAGANGINLQLANSNLTNPTFTSNNVSSNTLDGIRLVNPTTPSNTITAVFEGNTISSNGGTGVNLSLVTGGQSLNSSFGSNTITSNGSAGINIQLAANANQTGGFDSNNISSNGAQGVNIVTSTNGAVTSNFTNNTINGNKAEGINIDLSTGGAYNGPAFYGNTIGTAAAPNGSLGVRLTVPDQASYNWNLGSSTQAANLISGNAGAGVGILMTGASNGTLDVQNSTFSNTTLGSDANFTGQGLGIILNDTATLNNATIGNFNATNSTATNNTTFTNNAGTGLSIVGQGTTSVQNLMITNVNSTSNKGDGIDIFRNGNSVFNNITVQNSQINGNVVGLNILATNAFLADKYTINNNSISNNANDGVLLTAKYDSQIVADMDGNTINKNGGNGINVEEVLNAPSDNRMVSGLWTQNMITNNTLNGIDISARSNITIGLSTTQPNNTITGNGQDGILINGDNSASKEVINGDIISTNGANGVVVNATTNTVTFNTDTIWNNNGIGIDLLATNGASLTSTIDNTSIRNNSGTGVNIISSGQLNDATPATVSVLMGTIGQNDVSFNTGRGINVLNQVNGNAVITIDNTMVNQNGLEGVFIVNTASGDANGLGADGSLFDHTQMNLTMIDNTIQNNGHLSSDPTTGLVLLVGTNGASSASNNYTNPGGFASTASNVTSFATSGMTGVGGVRANVNFNTFGGNAGNDVMLQSFVSTVNPTTGTTWSGAVFDPTGYVPDPLARLDLSFVGNSGNAALLTNMGAFYNTNDPVFASRTNTQSPAGPFTSGARDRNAQYQASNAPPYNSTAALPPSDGGNFLYPGVGQSTFRVTTSSTTSAFLNTAAQNFGTQIQLNGGGDGQLPFGWSQNLAN